MAAQFKLKSRSVYLPLRSPRAAVVQLFIIVLKELLVRQARSLLKSLIALVLLITEGAKLIRWPALQASTLVLAAVVHPLTSLALAR